MATEKDLYNEFIKDYLKDGIKGYAKDQFFDAA